MEVYTIDNNGYIVAIKRVGNKYILQDNDIQGVPEYNLGQHHETGLEMPKTQAQLDAEEINELNNWLDLRRNIDHPDKSAKQARLLELLG